MTVNVFYYGVKTITLVSLIKATDQVKKAKNFISSKKEDVTSIFIEKDSINHSLVTSQDFDSFIKKVERRKFLTKIKKEIFTAEKR